MLKVNIFINHLLVLFQALEDAGVMPHIKRYVGASSGAMFASALAVGYTAQEISSCLFIDFTEVFNGMTTHNNNGVF